MQKQQRKKKGDMSMRGKYLDPKAETEQYKTQIEQYKAQIEQYKIEIEQYKAEIEQYKAETEQIKTKAMQEKLESARKLKAMGLPLGQIADILGLTAEEIEVL